MKAAFLAVFLLVAVIIWFFVHELWQSFVTRRRYVRQRRKGGSDA